MLSQHTILTRSRPTRTTTRWPMTTPRQCSALARQVTEPATWKDLTRSTILMDVSSMSSTTPMDMKALWPKSPMKERPNIPLSPNITPLLPSTMPLHLPITPLH